jgi:hypothetical protein
MGEIGVASRLFRRNFGFHRRAVIAVERIAFYGRGGNAFTAKNLFKDIFDRGCASAG